MAKYKISSGWKYKKVDKWRELWEKGIDKRFPANTKDWIMLDKTVGAIQKYTSDKWQVGAKRKINPITINGHYKFFKTRSSAIRFVRNYLNKY